MHIARWIPKVTNTHLGCVILINFLLLQWLHKRASMLRHTYTACLVLSLFFFVLWTEKLSKSRFPCQISSTNYLKYVAESPIKQKDLWRKVDTVNTRVRVRDVFGTQDSGQNQQQNLITFEYENTSWYGYLKTPKFW